MKKTSDKIYEAILEFKSKYEGPTRLYLGKDVVEEIYREEDLWELSHPTPTTLTKLYGLPVYIVDDPGHIKVV